MTVKDLVKHALLNADDFISGEEFAKSLNVSRNSVWKAVRSLKAEGFKIEAVNNRGYKLSDDNSIISEHLINKYLNAKTYGHKIIVLEEIDSTNNYAKKLAQDGADSGTVIISDFQSAGKGRLGRTFFSPKGKGLYLSIIIRPDIDLNSAQLITASTAVATAKAIEKICNNAQSGRGINVDIKWVNDLFVNNKKLCGILTEAVISFENKCLDYAVIGIGINIKSVAEFPSEIREIATSIEDESTTDFDRNALCAEILNFLELEINDMESRKFIDEYRRRSFIFGKKVMVAKNNKELIATAVDVDDNANLIVKLDDGECFTVNSGEARVIK